MKTELIQPATLVRSDRVMFLLQGVLIVIAFSFLYGPVVRGLVSDWYTYSPYSYGFLVPVLVTYLVWQKRQRLKTVALSPSHWGILTLVAAVLLLFIGQVIADSFVMRLSMVLAIATLIQAILGNCFLRELGFPIAYLVLMIPAPYMIVNSVVNYLMFFDARHSATILSLVGVPVYLDSNYLLLPNITLEVADACSGISSVFALFVLGVFYSHLLPLAGRLKILLVASTVPLAVIANIFRIVVTVGLTYYVGPVVLQSLFHKFHGTFNFLLSLLLFIVLAEILRKKSERPPNQMRNAEAPIEADYKPYAVKRRRRNAAVFSMLVIALAMWASARLEDLPDSPAPVSFANVPSSFAAFNSVAEAWFDAYHDIKAERSATNFYATPAGIPIEFFLGYAGGGIGGERLQSPKLVLPPRWNHLWVEPTKLRLGNVETIEANWMLTQSGRSRRLVLYWYQYAGGTFAGELYYRFALLKQRVMNHPARMMVIRIATPVLEDDHLVGAQERLKHFAAQAYGESTRLLAER